MHLGHISQTLHSMWWKEIKSISPPPDPRLPYRPGDPSPCVHRRRTTFKGILIISQGDVIKYCKHVLNESMSQRLQSVYRIKNLKAPKWDKTGEGEGKRERLKIKRKRKCLCDQRVDLKMYTKVSCPLRSLDHRGKKDGIPMVQGPTLPIPRLLADITNPSHTSSSLNLQLADITNKSH